MTHNLHMRLIYQSLTINPFMNIFTKSENISLDLKVSTQGVAGSRNVTHTRRGNPQHHFHSLVTEIQKAFHIFIGQSIDHEDTRPVDKVTELMLLELEPMDILSKSSLIALVKNKIDSFCKVVSHLCLSRCPILVTSLFSSSNLFILVCRYADSSQYCQHRPDRLRPGCEVYLAAFLPKPANIHEVSQ
jgi:hypothetical protein